MKKPEGVGEWDGYPMPDVPPDRKPLSKEEEDRILAEMHERIRKRLAEQQNQKQIEDKKAV